MCGSTYSLLNGAFFRGAAEFSINLFSFILTENAHPWRVALQAKGMIIRLQTSFYTPYHPFCLEAFQQNASGMLGKTF